MGSSPFIALATIYCLLLLCSATPIRVENGGYFAQVSSEAQPLSQSSTISYQVHSYNDLREWPQILRKGATYFKVDAHYMPSSFCGGQGQARQSEQGCFVLSHDTPVSTRQYNSTYSILNFIADPQYSEYYQNTEERVYIALCFKLDTAAPCDGSPAALNWTATTDAFFEAANEVVSSKQLNVEFVLDGSGAPTDSSLCLINKWRPWVSTWIPGDSATAPYSNNVTLGLDRFQIFNPSAVPDVPAYYIDIWKEQNYGKFSGGNYSYQIWEPSDQRPIMEIADSYLKGPIHALGLRYAINIDPVQLQVFAGSRSGNAWNYDIVTSDSNSLSSLSVSVVNSAINPSTFYVVATFLDNKDNTAYYSVSTAPNWNSTSLGYVDSIAPKPTPNNITILSTHSLNGTNLIYASMPNGNFALLNFTATMELSVVHSSKLSPCLECDSSPVFFGDLNYFSVIQTSNNVGSCSLMLQVWKVTNYTQTTPVGPGYCLQNSTTISHSSLSVHSSQNGDTLCANGFSPGILVFSDNNAQIYSSVLCVNTGTGAVIMNGGEGASILVDVGNDPSVSLYQSNGQLVVMEVHADGFCWNSEPNNKQPTPATCSNTPFSVPFVLNYNFGSFDQWTDHIMNVLGNKNQSYNLDSIFSSCHPTILHGVYDSGYSPQVTLFSATQGSVEVLLHAEIHLGLPKEYNNATQCGFALPTNGDLMLDSWNVNSWL